MQTPYEFVVGLRYTRAKRRNNFISFNSIASVVGIAIGVMALIVVLSVMNGFQREVRTRILSVASHLQITGPGNELADWRAVAERALRAPHVVAAAPFVNGQGLLVNGDRVHGMLVRGIVPDLEDKVVSLGGKLFEGTLSKLVPGEFGIILGADLARALRVLPGERVTLIAPQGLVTPAGVIPRLRQFTVVGVFEVGFFEYDSGLAFVHIQDAQRLYRMGGDVSGVRLRLDDVFRAPTVGRELARALGPDLFVSDWTRSHANFFRAVQIEKTMMFIILTMIVFVAAFNMVSTLVMAVTDKQADIAILRTLGATPFSIMQIFVVQGALISVIGTLLGLVAGVSLALNIDVVVPALERLLGIQFLSKDVYLISELPSELQSGDVIWVCAVSLALGFLATLYPSWRAARVRPAEALRYE